MMFLGFERIYVINVFIHTHTWNLYKCSGLCQFPGCDIVLYSLAAATGRNWVKNIQDLLVLFLTTA